MSLFSWGGKFTEKNTHSLSSPITIITLKKNRVIGKKFQIIFWSLNISNFKKSNLKTNFIIQSNIILAFIWNNKYVAQVSIWWNVMSPEDHFVFSYGSFLDFLWKGMIVVGLILTRRDYNHAPLSCTISTLYIVLF